MRNALIIAYYFPPLGGIGSLRASSFATYLPQLGWEVTVLAPVEGAYHRDPGLVFPEEKVVRSPTFELSRTGKRVLRAGGDDTSPAQPGLLRRTLQGAVRRYVYYPDAQIGWYLPAVRAGRRLMRQESFDVILSSAYPITAHLVARRLHRDTGVPWVAEYRDPFIELISDDPVTQRRARRLERSIAEYSASLVMTSPSWAQSQSQRWGRPVDVITNGCDGAIDSQRTDSEGFVLAHLGTLYPQRHDLETVWRAIRQLSETGDPTVDMVCFIGEPQQSVRAEYEAYGLASSVEVTGFLQKTEALGRMRTADALLLAGPKRAEGVLRGWIPAKVFEYLATDLPIIYVGDRGCDVADLLVEHAGTYLVEAGDVSGMMRALTDCRGERHRRNVSDFTREGLAERLAQVLDAASGASTPDR